jgi:hypothetical protein
MDNKYVSAYRILLSFMLIDNEIDEKEKQVVLDFLTTKFGKSVPQERKSVTAHK